MIDLTKLTTEQQNPKTKTIDEASALEIVKMINAEDQTVPKAVKKILPDISRAIIIIATGDACFTSVPVPPGGWAF